MFHAQRGAPRRGAGEDADGDESFGIGERHFSASELGDPTSEPCRNPFDPAPYEPAAAADEDEPPTSSFPSIFLPVADGPGTSMADAELKHTWHRMQALIAKCLETDSTPADTVDMVHEFYTKHILSQFADAGEWTKRSIYEYVYRSPERQCVEVIQAVNHTMEFLRSQMASRSENGKVKVNSEHVKLFLASAKVHASLVDAKRKRESR